MRSRISNPQMTKKCAVLFAAAASLALSSCAASQERMAHLRPAPYFALTSAGGTGANVRQTGYLTEENGCVVLRPADSSPAMTPVFPKGETALVTDGTDWLGVYLRGAPVVMEKVYRLSGAKTGPAGAPALSVPAPAGCPSTYFVVGSVATSIADGNANRFCAGVTICRAFGID